MRRDLGILAGVSAAALAIGLISQSGLVRQPDTDPQNRPGAAAPESPPSEQAATPEAAAPEAIALPLTATAPAKPPAASPETEAEIARLEAALAAGEADYAALAATLAKRTRTLAERDAALAGRDDARAERDATLEGRAAEAEARNAELAAALADREAEIRSLRADLAALRERFAFDVELAAAKAGTSPGAAPVAAARVEAVDLDDMLAGAKAGAAERPMTAIHFENGSAAITPGGQVHAAVAAAMLSEMPLERIRLIGFADTTGDPVRNLRLAERRAETVAALLVAAGLPADRIETRGVTEADALPVVTAAGVAEPLNRSVSIIAVPPPTT